MPSGILKLTAAAVIAISLTACKSVEERAEEKYQSGLALMQDGDLDRAAVEFRNVFELDGTHREARFALADILLSQGKRRAGYSQYLRIAEQYPDDLEARLTMSELAFEMRNWRELERHGEAARRLAPDNMRTQMIGLAEGYRQAVVNDDASARIDIAETSQELVRQFPDSTILRNILVDTYTRSGDYDDAIENVEHLIGLQPDNRDLYSRKLSLLAEMGDDEAVEQQLKVTIDAFPEDPTVKSALLRYYLGRGELEEAEAFLRDIVDPESEDPGAMLDLIRFVAETKGEQAARAELETAISQSPDPTPFLAMRAALDFGSGARDKAVADMEALIESREAGPETNDIKIALARMLLTMGNIVGAQQLVDAVVEDDQFHVEALKMKAAWQIENDETDLAISNLRTAIDGSPDDSDAMTLMAQAYSRTGNHELSRDFLALAVEASGNAPTESIRYANTLIALGSNGPAEDVLIQALRLAPNNVDLLGLLGRVYVEAEDRARARQVTQTLRRIDTPQANSLAATIEAEQLRLEGGSDEALAFLEDLAAEQDGDINAQLLLLRGRLAAGDAEGARELSERLAADNPDFNVAAAAVRSATGDLEGAEQIYRDLLAENQEIPRVWLELSRVLLRQGKQDQAKTAVEDALELNPDDANLLWARASILERDGKFDDAIAIYERLYEQSSNSPIIANNLASLLSAYRDDDASLERAFTVARRLNETNVPAFQDTYGWILHRRGQTEEALPYLESAAAGLEDDALTQYHLAVAYEALGSTDMAIEQYQKAVSLAGVADTREQISDARAALARLREE